MYIRSLFTHLLLIAEEGILKHCMKHNYGTWEKGDVQNAFTPMPNAKTVEQTNERRNVNIAITVVFFNIRPIGT